LRFQRRYFGSDLRAAPSAVVEAADEACPPAESVIKQTQRP